jgi:4-hydroxybenzoyl-CoA reductase subunit beta
MILPKFDYQAPESVSKVCSLLSQANGRAAIKAGGTDLMVQMMQRTQVPELVIGLNQIPELQGLSYSEPDGLRIGPMVSLQKLANASVVKDTFPVLAETATMVGAVQHQFMGTVGGNLCLNTRCWYYNQSADWRRSLIPCHKLGGDTCHAIKGSRSRKCYAVYSADVGSVLFALDARLVLSGSQGEKIIPLDEFFGGDLIKPTNLGKDEIVTEIIVPPQRLRFARYYKPSLRGALDFPKVGVAFIACPENKDYRFVISAVDRKPARFKDLEAGLSQQEISRKRVMDFAAEVTSRIRTVANVSGSPAYRRQMVNVLINKAFTEMGVVS